jgi:hypothetical protein
VDRPIDRFVINLRMPRKSPTCDFVPSSAAGTASLASTSELAEVLVP